MEKAPWPLIDCKQTSCLCTVLRQTQTLTETNKNLFGRSTQVCCAERACRRAHNVCRWNNCGVDGSISCFENTFGPFFHENMAHEQQYSAAFGLKRLSYKRADARCHFCCKQRLQHKLIRAFDSGCFIGRTSRELVVMLEVQVEEEVGSVWLGIDSVWDWDRGWRSQPW